MPAPADNAPQPADDSFVPTVRELLNQMGLGEDAEQLAPETSRPTTQQDDPAENLNAPLAQVLPDLASRVPHTTETLSEASLLPSPSGTPPEVYPLRSVPSVSSVDASSSRSGRSVRINLNSGRIHPGASSSPLRADEEPAPSVGNPQIPLGSNAPKPSVSNLPPPPPLPADFLSSSAATSNVPPPPFPHGGRNGRSHLFSPPSRWGAQGSDSREKAHADPPADDYSRRPGTSQQQPTLSDRGHRRGSSIGRRGSLQHNPSPRRDSPRRERTPPRHDARPRTPRSGRPSTPEGALIDVIGLPLREYQEKVASAYLDMETKLNQLAICDPNRKIAALEIRVAKTEEFEYRLVGAESRFYAINDLERRVAMLEHRQELQHDELCGMRTSLGSVGILTRIDDHIRQGEEHLAKANEHFRCAHDLGWVVRHAQASDRHGNLQMP